MRSPATHSISLPRSTWIISRFWDSVLFIGAPLLSVAVFLPLRRFFSSEQLAVFLLAFFTFGHHLPGFIRAYGDHELFARYRLRFLLAPPLIFSTALWFDLRGLHGLIIFVFAWDIWHVLMQHYGFMRIYDAKRGETSALTAHLDRAVSLAWYVTLIVASPHYRHNLLLHSYATGIPVVPPGLFQALTVALYAATGLLTAAYMGYNAWLWRQGRFNARKLALLGIFVAVTWYLYVGLEDFLLGFVVWSAFHCIQYYGIVWAFNVNRVAKGSAVSRFVRFLFRPRLALVLLYGSAILLYGAINYMQMLLADANLLRYLLAFVFTSNALHYYYDGFIWKVREPETRRHLDITSGNAAGARDVKRPLWLGRGALQAAYLLGVALLLAAVEAYRPPDAVESARSLATLAPEVGDAYYNLGNALRQQGQLAEAEQQYREAQRRMPGSAKVRINLGGVLYDEGRWDDAVEQFREASSLHDDARPAQRRVSRSPLIPISRIGQEADRFVIESNLADALVRQGSATEAVEHYRRALDIDPHAADVRANLGATLSGLGQQEEGVKELEAALQSGPGHAGARLLLASVLAYQGDLNAALKHYEAATTSGDAAILGNTGGPANPAYAQAHMNVGVRLAGAGRIDEAVAAYEKALACDPRFAAAHFNLGSLFESRNEIEKALSHYRQAIDGDQPEARRLALKALQRLDKP